jgi:hypothetical protein
VQQGSNELQPLDEDFFQRARRVIMSISCFVTGFTRRNVTRTEDRDFSSSDLLYIASVADNIETELVAMREEIADIEGRLKTVAEKWELAKSAGPS